MRKKKGGGRDYWKVPYPGRWGRLSRMGAEGGKVLLVAGFGQVRSELDTQVEIPNK